MTASVRAAAIQAAPVFLDRDATIEKACASIEKASADGARLIVFPETYVPAYPDWVWRTRPWDAPSSDLFERLVDQSVVVGSPATDILADAARRAGAHVAIGINEREAHGSTIYNTLLHISADGAIVHRHRKLMPTGAERLVWGQGDGSSLGAVQTPFGRVGGLICWENYMPLARTALYAAGIDVYLAPTWDNSDTWVPTLRHIAKEGRVYVVGVTFCMRGSDIPSDVPHRDELWGGDDDWLARGNSTIVGPEGDVLAGPLVGEEGIVVADLDIGRLRRVRQHFDPVGHYARPDVLRLTVDGRPAVPVTSDVTPDAEGTGGPVQSRNGDV